MKQNILIFLFLFCFAIQSICQQATKHKLKWQNGNLKEEGMLQGGKKEGQWIEYYQNGNIKTVKQYNKGSLLGKYYEFDSVGNISYIRTFKKNIQEGEHLIFNEDGNLLIRGEYKKCPMKGYKIDTALSETRIDTSYYNSLINVDSISIFSGNWYRFNNKGYLSSHTKYFPGYILYVKKDDTISSDISESTTFIVLEFKKFDENGDVIEKKIYQHSYKKEP